MPGQKTKASLLDHRYETADYDVRDRSERLAKPLTAVGIVVAVACLASTAANVYFYLQKNAAQESSPQSCFHCDEIESYPVDWSKVEQQREDPNLCCMQPNDFLNLVEKVSLTAAKHGLASALSSMPIGTNGAQVSYIRPSVHLGLPGSVRRVVEARGCNVTTEIKSWRTGANGHVRGDLTIKSGRIYINTTGFYHVYSQVSSEDKSSGSVAKPAQRHSIVRDNPSLNVVADELLTAETTRCKDLPGQQSGDGGSNSLTSSYLGAALLLLKDDEVTVETIYSFFSFNTSLAYIKGSIAFNSEVGIRHSQECPIASFQSRHFFHSATIDATAFRALGIALRRYRKKSARPRIGPRPECEKFLKRCTSRNRRRYGKETQSTPSTSVWHRLEQLP